MTLLAAAEKNGSELSREELRSNAPVIVFAGSEASATALSGLLFYLLQSPEAYAKLTKEARTAIPN